MATEDAPPAPPDLDAVAATALEIAAAQLGTQHACLILPDASGGMPCAGWRIGLFVDSAERSPKGQDLLEAVARSGQRILLTDYAAWPAGSGPNSLIGAILCVPLGKPGLARGALAVAHAAGSGRTFSESDATLLEGLGALASIALGCALDGAGARQAAEEAERLSAATEALSASLEVSEVLVRILSELRKVVPYDSASVQELSGDRLTITGGHGFPDLERVLGISFDVGLPELPNSEVVRRRAPVIVADAANHYGFFEYTTNAKEGIRSWLGVPLLFRDQFIGMLALDSQEINFYTERHGQLAMAFAARAAIAIWNARLHSAAQAELAARERTEQLLAKSENLLRTIIESEPECVKLLAVDGSLLQMNPAGLAMLEAESFEQVARRPLMDLVAPEWRPAFREHIEAVFRGETADLEFQVVGLRGGQRWLETRAVPLRDADGGILALLGVTRDVTARKQSESALRRSEARLAEAQRIAHIGSWERDFTTDEMWGSAEAYALFGLSGQPSLSYETAISMIHPEDREHARQVAAQGLADRAPYQVEYRIVRPDGTVRDVHAEGLLQFDDGRPVLATGTVQDITDRKRAEQALRESDEKLRQAQRIESLGQLAGGVAHDFNNLLGVIVGYAELLTKELPAGTRGRARLDQILAAAQRAATLTLQLLAFSRRQVLQPRQLDLNAVVRGIEAALARLLGDKIELAIATADGIGAVLADPGQLEQVLTNLASNAGAAMPGGGRLLIETGRAELAQDDPSRPTSAPPGSYGTLTVSDTGVGMDEATRARIFEPFFTTAGHGQGTGLGLAMVHGFVKQSGGFVEVHSAPGEGASFRIYLPRIEAPPAVVESTPRPAPITVETLLVVEDETALRELMSELLTEQGYRVLLARHGEEAVEVSARHAGAIDLLITDMVMPGMNGRELAERLSASRPLMGVLYISGYADHALRNRGDLLGAPFELLPKPFTAAALADKVRNRLDARPAN